MAQEISNLRDQVSAILSSSSNFVIEPCRLSL